MDDQTEKPNILKQLEEIHRDMGVLKDMMTETVSTKSKLAERVFLKDVTGTLGLLCRVTGKEIRRISRESRYMEYPPAASQFVGTLTHILLNRISKAFCFATADQIRGRLK